MDIKDIPALAGRWCKNIPILNVELLPSFLDILHFWLIFAQFCKGFPSCALVGPLCLHLAIHALNWSINLTLNSINSGKNKINTFMIKYLPTVFWVNYVHSYAGIHLSSHEAWSIFYSLVPSWTLDISVSDLLWPLIRLVFVVWSFYDYFIFYFLPYFHHEFWTFLFDVLWPAIMWVLAARSLWHLSASSSGKDSHLIRKDFPDGSFYICICTDS